MGFGGQLDLLDGLESDLHYLFSDPSRCRLPDSRLPDEISQPKVMVESDDEWHAVVSLLHQRGVVAATKLEEVPRVRGRALLQGAFGIYKPWKFLTDRRAGLRFIMDGRATDAVLIKLLDDLSEMAGATSLLRMVVLENEVVLYDAEDLVSAFYLLLLPRSWWPYFTFARTADGSALGLPAGTQWYVSSRVLPMGFSGATALLQHLHHRCLLGRLQPSLSAGLAGVPTKTEIRAGRPMPLSSSQGERQAWKIYLDDVLGVRVVNKRFALEFSGKSSWYQVVAWSHYEVNKVPTGADKAVAGESQINRLGYHHDGQAGFTGLSAVRTLKICSLGFKIIDGASVSLIHLQVFSGKVAHAVQLRRPLWSILCRFWWCFQNPYMS